MPELSRQSVYASGDYEVDLGRRELRAGGVPVPIGSRAFELVEVLVSSAGDLITKSDLMDHVWPGAIVNDNTLQVHIAAVRKALGARRSVLKTESGGATGCWETGPSRTALRCRKPWRRSNLWHRWNGRPAISPSRSRA